jgi:hypothetical protein
MPRLRRRALAGATVLFTVLTSGALVSSQPRPAVPLPIPEVFQESDAGDGGPLPETLNQVDPQILVDDRDGVYRLWVDHWAGQGRHIRFQRSIDGGDHWLPAPLMLDRDKPAGARSTVPAFTVDPSGRVMAIWRTKGTGSIGKQLRFSSSTDRGATWSASSAILNRKGRAFGGSLSTDGKGHVYVAWYDERQAEDTGGAPPGKGMRIFFNRSEDFGATWLAEDLLLSGPGATDLPAPASEPGARARGRRGGAFISALPRTQADGQGRVFVVWVDNREGRSEIYFRASENHGKNWGPEVNVSRGGSSATNHQLLTDGRGRLYVLWTDTRYGFEDVFFARSEDAGRQWAEPQRLSHHAPGVAISTRPNMALGANGELYVAWQDRRNGREDIYFTLSADGGRTWLPQDLRLDTDDPGTGVSREPFVVTHPRGAVAVLWEDDRTGFEQVLMNWSSDGGRSWLAREVRVDTLTAPHDRARKPRAAWDRAGRLHVVWEIWRGEGRQVERRVDYRRLAVGPLGSP